MRPRNIPTDEILFAAKMGFLSKALWNEFFGTHSKSWRSREWRSLTGRKVFLPHPSPIAKDILVPNPNNMMVRNLVGSDLSSPPYAGHIGHDDILAQILIRLLRAEVIHDFTCEAEQKRRHVDRRRWSERLEKIKFPDAILRLGSRDRAMSVALEVELTAKCQKRYRKIFDTYQDRKEIEAVVFVIQSTGIFNSLNKALKDSHYPNWEKPVGFGRVDEWIKDPGNAPIRFPNQTTSIIDLGRTDNFHLAR